MGQFSIMPTCYALEIFLGDGKLFWSESATLEIRCSNELFIFPSYDPSQLIVGDRLVGFSSLLNFRSSKVSDLKLIKLPEQILHTHKHLTVNLINRSLVISDSKGSSLCEHSPQPKSSLSVSRANLSWFPYACGSYFAIKENCNKLLYGQYHYLHVENQKIIPGPYVDDIQFFVSTVTPDGYHLLMAPDTRKCVFVIEMFNMHNGTQVQRWILPFESLSVTSLSPRGQIDAMQVIAQRCCLLVRVRPAYPARGDEVRFYVCKPTMEVTAPVSDLSISLTPERRSKATGGCTTM